MTAAWTRRTAGIRHDQCPPDLLGMQFFVGELCPATGGVPGDSGYGCTRLRGHTGRHAASIGEVIVAVWQ